MITRAALESELVERTRSLLVRVGLSDDPSSDPSPRSYLGGPILSAALESGGTAAVPGTIDDADLAGLADSDWNKVCDVAHLRLLEKCLDNWDLFTNAATDRSVSYGEGRTALAQRIADLRKYLQTKYQIGISPARTGWIELGYAGGESTAEF